VKSLPPVTRRLREGFGRAAVVVMTVALLTSLLLAVTWTPALSLIFLRERKGDLQDVIGRDWQNSYADFATILKRELSQIRDAKAREEAVAAMRAVLESYKTARATQIDRKRA